MTKKTNRKNSLSSRDINKRRNTVSHCESCGRVPANQCQDSHLVKGRSEDVILLHCLQCQQCHSLYEDRNIHAIVNFNNFSWIMDTLKENCHIRSCKLTLFSIMEKIREHYPHLISRYE